MNCYGDLDIIAFRNISNEAALNWLEEANRFFFNIDRNKWKKDEENMKKIGW
jgi:hypothetical protein